MLTVAKHLSGSIQINYCSQITSYFNYVSLHIVNGVIIKTINAQQTRGHRVKSQNKNSTSQNGRTSNAPNWVSQNENIHKTKTLQDENYHVMFIHQSRRHKMNCITKRIMENSKNYQIASYTVNQTMGYFTLPNLN